MRYTKATVTACENVEIGLKKALELKGEDDILFIAGSLYLVGEIKEAMKVLN